MKKLVLIILLCFLFCSNSSFANIVTYKVLKIIDGDTFVIDFNSNGEIDKNEKVRVNGIDTFETKNNAILKRQADTVNITTEQALKMGYLAKKFAERNLLNKNVKIVYSGKSTRDYYGRELVSVYYDCNRKGYCKSYEEEILKMGYASIYKYSNIKKQLKSYYNLEKIQNNAKKTEKINIVVLDEKRMLYHEINCPNAWKFRFAKLTMRNQLNKKAKLANCCN